MCGRFARRSTQEVLSDWFGISLEQMPWFVPSFNIAPQSTQPIVRTIAGGSGRECSLARWGLVPAWARDAKIGFSTINARAEDAASKPAFRVALKKRRCLVPADAFYEWQRAEGKSRNPHAIALASGEPFALAGLWESWKSREEPPLETFTVLTTEPNELMAPIHNRMPVILEPSDYDLWLTPEDNAPIPMSLFKPFPASRMRAWPVSSRVGNVRNNDPKLLQPLDKEPSEKAARAPRKQPPSLFDSL
jgi:putative SOS response-associated peptidase YedK